MQQGTLLRAFFADAICSSSFKLTLLWLVDVVLWFTIIYLLTRLDETLLIFDSRKKNNPLLDFVTI